MRFSAESAKKELATSETHSSPVPSPFDKIYRISRIIDL